MMIDNEHRAHELAIAFAQVVTNARHSERLLSDDPNCITEASSTFDDVYTETYDKFLKKFNQETI